MTQNISFTNNHIGAVNIAEHDMRVTNQSVFGDALESVQTLLRQMYKTINDDPEMNDSQKKEAVNHIITMKNELNQPKPRVDKVMQILGHLATIGTLVTVGNQFGHLLVNTFFPIAGMP